MAEMLGATRMLERQQRMKAAKVRALDLCSMALEVSNSLFDRGDLFPYIEILSRFHCYNFYNLLLILRQYPEATHLAPFAVWQNQMKDPSQRVLKKEYIGKGIELIAPYTDLQPQGTRALSWYGIRKFDVTQTTITDFQPPPKGYFAGANHLKALLLSLRSVLSRQYNMSILMDSPESSFYAAGNAGYREDHFIHCRRDLSDPEQLLWLSENVVELSAPEQVIGERHKTLFCQLATNCLLRIWDITDRSLLYLRQDAELIQSVPADLRPVFLDLLQRRVRQTEELVYSRYQEHRRNREEEARMNAVPTLSDQTIHPTREEASAP